MSQEAVVPQFEATTWKSRSRWEDNTKMGFKEILWKTLNWIHVAQNSDK